MSDNEGEYDSDIEGGYASGKIEAARYEDDGEDAALEPFLKAIYEFKLAANAAFREYYMSIHREDTKGVEEYQDYLRAIQSLWNSKQRTLATTLTAPYKKLPRHVQDTLQSMLDAIHSANTPEHSYASSYWIRRLFMECAGSTNMRSFKACEHASQAK